MNKLYLRLLVVFSICSVLALSVPSVLAKPVGVPRGPGGHPPVYVISQDRYYDTIVPILSIADGGKGLPWSSHNTGSFQELYPTGGPTGGLAADFGPGDPGYRGGRWWIDNGPGAHANNDIQDFDDTYFLCPLLGGPVRYEPLT